MGNPMRESEARDRRTWERVAVVLACLLIAAGLAVALLPGSRAYRVGEAVQHANLAIYPVYSRDTARAKGYGVLGEALTSDAAEVWEPFADAGDGTSGSSPAHYEQHVRDVRRDERDRGLPIGSVESLFELLNPSALVGRRNGAASLGAVTVRNDSGLELYVPAGLCVIGGWQDRVVSVGTVIPGRTTRNVSILCVEAGRSEGPSHLFETAAALAHPRLRRLAQEPGQGDGVQEAVWEEVRAANARLGQAPATQTYRAAVEGQGSVAKQHPYVAAIEPALRDDPEALGAVAAIDGRIVCADVFGDRKTFQRLWPQLARSYAVGALQTPSSADAEAPSVEEAELFIAEALNAPETGTRVRGATRTVRAESQGRVAFGTQHKKKLIHLAAFAKR